MKFCPCIDLHNGQVKQIVGGSLNENNDAETNFVSDHSPAYYAEMYRRDNLTGGHVIMLGKGNEAAAMEALADWPGGMQVGGGITTENALLWLGRGASHVIITSYIFRDGELNMDNLKSIAKLIGRDKLVLDLSCRWRDGAYWIVTDRWQKFTNWQVNAEILDFLSGYCCEFLVHAVDVEGSQAGIDPRLLEILAEHSPIGCVYAGGIASFDDISKIAEAGNGKISFTVGSALDIFGGKLPYREVIDFTNKLNERPQK
jgi:phosphoribosylformimino-5-aminoimidazole carboxamide ribotide isomerase